jgi:hypothetical protein
MMRDKVTFTCDFITHHPAIPHANTALGAVFLSVLESDFATMRIRPGCAMM